MDDLDLNELELVGELRQHTLIDKVIPKQYPQDDGTIKQRLIVYVAFPLSDEQKKAEVTNYIAGYLSQDHCLYSGADFLQGEVKLQSDD